MIAKSLLFLLRQYNAALKGGAKGAAAGLGLFLPTAYLLHQRWAPFRHLPLQLKAFFVTTGSVALAVIAADKSGLAFEVSAREDLCDIALYH
jgi:hypothetical protein